MAIRITEGVEIYAEAGDSQQAGPTLLLLHGLGATGDVWRGMVPLLERQWKGRWIIPDLRGHGRSSYHAPYSYATYAADVANLLDQDEEVIVLGHSIGGLIAAALATGWYGVRVQNVVAFAVKIRWTAEEVAKLAQLAAAPVRWFNNEGEAVERYLKVSGLAGLLDVESAQAKGGVREEGGRFRLAADPRTNGAAGPDVAELLKAVRVPMRLAAGSKDPMVEREHMVPFDPRAIILEGLGHNAHVEDPQRIFSLLLDAIEGRA